jgi:hypothetical protein
VFRPAPGATVVVDCDTTSTNGGRTIRGERCWDVAVSHVEFRRLETRTYTVAGFSYQGRVDTERGITDVVFDDVDVGSVILAGDDEHVRNSDLGPSVDPLNNRCCGGWDDTWVNNTIHDFRIKNGGHFECVTWDGGNGHFVGNRFSGCDVFAIFSKPVVNTSGEVTGNTFAPDPATHEDVKLTTSSSPKRCDVSVSRNRLANGRILDCSGVVVGGTAARRRLTTRGT